MNVTAYLTSSKTVNYTSVHCADKDSPDMPKRIVLTITTMEVFTLPHLFQRDSGWNSRLQLEFLESG